MKGTAGVLIRRYWKYGFCIGTGILLFLMAEWGDQREGTVENQILKRNPCGKGDQIYEFYVEGDGMERIEVSVAVPEKRPSKEEFHQSIPAATELLCERILGENPSLDEVRSDLELVKSIPEYGISVSWESDQPEFISDMGVVSCEEVQENGKQILLRAGLSCGDAEETVEIPVIIFPEKEREGEALLKLIESLAASERDSEEVILPGQFHGISLSYRKKDHLQNAVLIFLGIGAASCLCLKEQNDRQIQKRNREESLTAEYSNLVSGFLILTGAGYSIKQAWRKLAEEHEETEGTEALPVYKEMQTTLHQMAAGMPERQAYAEFGRRCGLRSYVKFASLLETSLSSGGKNLRALLEDEMEEAFKGRADLARRKGEEASAKLLIPMFGMLGIVMVMVVAPAFLSLG